MNVATYVRARADDKRTEAEKRKHQQDCLDRWALERGLEVVAVFQDCGTSANDMSRPGLSGLLEAASKTPRPFDVVLVANASRLARDVSEFLHLEKRLRGVGVEIQFQDQPWREGIDLEEVRQVVRLLDDYWSRGH